MGSIALLARYMHRPAAALRSLVFAVGAMLLWNPLYVFDTGFVLSFLAVFGIITLGAVTERKLFFIPAWKKFNLRSIAATTLAAEVMILPAVLYFSGVLSFVSFPVNVLLLPLVPLIMYLGFVVGLLALVHPLLASAPALVLNMLLAVFIAVVTKAAALPFASTTIAAFPWWAAAIVYVPLGIFALLVYTKSNTKRKI
jgi:competence protein ComEC